MWMHPKYKRGQLNTRHSFTMSDSEGSTLTNRWTIGSRRVPKEEIVFLSQTLIISIVIISYIYNLSRSDRKDENIWTTLLGSCLGYMLPNPSLKSKK